MKPNRPIIFVLATTGLLLASCASTPTPTESTSEQQSQTSSGSSARRWAEMSVEHSSIRAGSTFLDGAKPTTIYHPLSGNPIDKGNSGSMTIKKTGDAETTYSNDEPLSPGSYTVSNTIFVEGGHSVSTSCEFSVTEGTSDKEDASGNVKGVNKSVTADSMANYKFMNYSGIDTLGKANTASGCMPSTGNTKVLVIPVAFSNASFGDEATTANARAMINEAFFAKNDKTAEEVGGKVPDTTPWESLSSYYEKASSGKLHISGYVTPVYTYNKADTTITDDSISHTIADEAIKAFKQGYGGYTLNASDFDSDHDGFIDGVEMVYVTTQPQPEGGSGIWWNYTTSTSKTANVASPNEKRIFWARWDYLKNGYYSAEKYSKYGLRDAGGLSVDAHTIVHETGHMMGAADYYSYAEDTAKKFAPAGCVDMMDMNVGDHNAYTKMAYGWVTPWVVDYKSNDFEVTLPSYTDTKQFLIVPSANSEWNGTPWDEYLLLEYYTPTGVNEMDSTGYAEWQAASSSGDNTYGHGGTYRKPGLQMFHVDERTSSQTGSLVNGQRKDAVRNWTKTPKSVDTENAAAKTFETAAEKVLSNTPAGTAKDRAGSLDGVTKEASPYRELHAIFPSSQNSCDSASYYSTFGVMANLFGLQSYYEKDGETYGEKPDTKYGGDYFTPSHNKNWFVNGTKFDNGDDFGWTIQIEEQTDDSVKLHFINNLAN